MSDIQDWTQAVDVTGGTVEISGPVTITTASGEPIEATIAGTVTVQGSLTSITDTVTVAQEGTVNVQGVSGGTAVGIEGSVNADISGPVTIETAGGTPIDATITGTVNLASGSTVEISGTPTVDLATGATVEISGTPTVDLATGTTVEISGTPTVDLASGTTVDVSSVGEIVAGSVTVENATATQLAVATGQWVPITSGATTDGEFSATIASDGTITFATGSSGTTHAIPDGLTLSAFHSLAVLLEGPASADQYWDCDIYDDASGLLLFSERLFVSANETALFSYPLFSGANGLKVVVVPEAGSIADFNVPAIYLDQDTSTVGAVITGVPEGIWVPTQGALPPAGVLIEADGQSINPVAIGGADSSNQSRFISVDTQGRLILPPATGSGSNSLSLGTATQSTTIGPADGYGIIRALLMSVNLQAVSSIGRLQITDGPNGPVLAAMRLAHVGDYHMVVPMGPGGYLNTNQLTLQQDQGNLTGTAWGTAIHE